MRKIAFYGLAFVALAGCGRPPQVAGDPDAFREVDALYTAVAAKNPRLLDQCDQRLQGLKSQGKLGEPAYLSLQGIITHARAGDWKPALEKLTAFMKGQRRPQN